jgi:hypothetical protein
MSNVSVSSASRTVLYGWEISRTVRPAYVDRIRWNRWNRSCSARVERGTGAGLAEGARANITSAVTAVQPMPE